MVMKAKIAIVSAAVGCLCLGTTFLLAQQAGPQKQNSETVAKPKKKDATTAENTDKGKIPSQFKKDKELPPGVVTFSSDVITVALDVAVLDNKGHFIPNIPAGAFRVLEDNVPQKVASYSIGEAPMTVCMVIEFSNRYQQFYSGPWYETLTAAYGFLETLKPEDYVAIVAYDMRPEIISDFSTDKRQAYEGMQRLRIAGFSESNLYDALTDTANRMQDIEGRKAIVVISSGVDTFSKITFDKARKELQEAGVPIYAIGIMQALRAIYDAQMGAIERMDFLQADNQMRTFAKETGGMSFFPRFFGEFPQIYRAISDALRNQYSLTYHPTNQARDGKFRKIKVDLINSQTGDPVKVLDEKGKPIKYQIIAKAGYTAPHAVE